MLEHGMAALNCMAAVKQYAELAEALEVLGSNGLCKCSSLLQPARETATSTTNA